MDNFKGRISNIKFQIEELRTALAAASIKFSVRHGTGGALEDIRYSIVVGKHKERWLIRLYPQAGSLTFSGGVTKTFFGHNLWVFNNEYVQLQSIIGILARELGNIGGITLPDSLRKGLFDDVAVERVELTNHFALPPAITQAQAIERIDKVFMVLFPHRRDRDGDTLSMPGTTSIGKSKSSKVCRVYDPSLKFASRPDHIPQKIWTKLTTACADHLRVELIMDKREIESLDLQTVDAWQDDKKIRDYLVKKSLRYGLTVEYKAGIDKLLPSDVRETNPAFVDLARFWITVGQGGKAPDKRSGTYTRFRQYMANLGFNVNVPLEHHQHLTHGLHDILKPEARADLASDLRRDQELFLHWWKKKP